jgi:hypothetical protein
MCYSENMSATRSGGLTNAESADGDDDDDEAETDDDAEEADDDEEEDDEEAEEDGFDDDRAWTASGFFNLVFSSSINGIIVLQQRVAYHA